MRIWPVRERHYGGAGVFHIGECEVCPVLTLLDPPDDPQPFYPPDYAAFAGTSRSWRRPIRRLRNRVQLGRRGPVAALARRLKRHAASRFLDHTGATRDWRVLDVGSGAGALLQDLADAGFRHLQGVDRFIPREVNGDGYRVIRGTIEDVDGRFDLVMLHHSLEHMRDPRAALRGIATRLAPDGWCVIRIPVFPSAAWDKYQLDWFQLDAPRHENIFSVRLLEKLATEAGLQLEGVQHDSTAHQFAGAEGYRRGFRLNATDRYFAPSQMRGWARTAADLNAAGRGDQAILYFRRLASRP